MRCRIRVRPSARRQFAFPVLLVTHEREEHARAEGGRAMIRAGNGGVKVREFVDIFLRSPFPSPGRVEEEINKISPHLMPKIPPLAMMMAPRHVNNMNVAVRREPIIGLGWIVYIRTELFNSIPAKFCESLSKCSAAHPKIAMWHNISASGFVSENQPHSCPFIPFF